MASKLIKIHNILEREKIIWNFDNVQKAYATRGYEAKNHNILEYRNLYNFTSTLKFSDFSLVYGVM
jgi:hypothetical protein